MAIKKLHEVILRRLAGLKPIEDNIRSHPQPQIDEYIRSLEKFGQVKPMVIDENDTILIGNGMHKALTQMGRRDAYAIKIEGLTETEKRKLMMSDNKIYELGIIDNEVLTEILAGLGKKGVYDVPGYREDVLKSLFSSLEAMDDKIQSYGELDKERVADTNEVKERIEERTEEGYSSSGKIELANDNIKVEDDTAYINCPRCNKKLWL